VLRCVSSARRGRVVMMAMGITGVVIWRFSKRVGARMGCIWCSGSSLAFRTGSSLLGYSFERYFVNLSEIYSRRKCHRPALLSGMSRRLNKHWNSALNATGREKYSRCKQIRICPSSIFMVDMIKLTICKLLPVYRNNVRQPVIRGYGFMMMPS